MKVAVTAAGVALALAFVLSGLVYSALVREVCPYDVDALTQ